jgi:hypothetical protein
MKIPITTTVEHELRDLAINEKIAITEALEFGIKFLLAQKGVLDYPDNRLLANMSKLQQALLTKEEAEVLK